MAKAYKKRVLGRGLSAILSENDNNRFSENRVNSISKILIDNIKLNPNQPRTNFDQKAIEELASSIKELGLIQPITIQKNNESYELISGERRLRAFKFLNLNEIPAYVREADDQTSLEMALVENIQRKDLDPIEIANDTTKKLKETENCDLVICLSHLGYKYEKFPNRICDVNLAKETKDIDLIIGGHTHTFMNEPLITYNKAGKKVLINQAGCFGLYLGRIDFLFDSNNNKIFNSNLLMI